MKTKRYILSCMILCAICFFTPSYSQDKEIILVKGNPPLTQLMVGKTIVLLDWVLDLRLSKDQELKIKDIVVNAWKTTNKAAIKSTSDIIDVYEKVFKLNAAEQNKLKEKMQPAILQNLYKEPKDELSALVLAAYETAHAIAPKKMGDENSNLTGSQKNNNRVGADGFTGIYRMLRPKSININSTTGFESGYWIEYITFLPGGHLYWNLPPEGLLYFDTAVAQRADPDDWGSYEFKNGEIHVLRGADKTKYIITRSGERLNNPESLGKGSFRSIPASDGLRLEGNYRRHETEPTITFTKDGRFTDGGIFRFFGTIGRLDGTSYMDDGVGGSGSYLINQNTLELKYSDGRIKLHVFIAFPENLMKKPDVESFLLYEQRLERY